MEYRNFKKIKTNPSLLGFGCMRFPTLPNGKIDVAQVEEMFKYAIENGVTYFDTAYPYHGGESELVVGEVLKKYPRESFNLTTKLPVWLLKETSDVSKYFEEQRKKLQTEYFDFYLLHALSKERYVLARDLGVFDILEQYKKEGKIKHLGFSFHSTLEDFEYILNDGLAHWDFCQIQLNYMDLEHQQGMKGYEELKAHDIPVIIMEPLKGGLLARLPQDISKVFTDYNSKSSIASWAFRFIGSFSQVSTILSGMGSIEQVKDNIATFNKFKPVNAKELELIDKVRTLIKSRIYVGCTGCDYCIDCPREVRISKIFKYVNNKYMYENINNIKNDKDIVSYNIDKCISCKKCEKKCPQGIKISSVIQEILKA
jgi:predicted aldo/keto reductase-like oxidoreductase